MPTPDADIINRIASRAMGLPPEAAAAAAGQPAAAAPGAAAADPAAAAAAAVVPAAPQAQQAPGKDTPEAQAQTAAAPTDPAAMAAVVFELPGKEGKPGRKFTAAQIEGMADRYSALNYEHAQLKPVIDLAREMLRNNPNMTPADLRDAVVSLAKANEKNPQMGNQAREQTAQQQGLPADDALTAWEQENAISLPPGYREFMNQSRSMQQMLGQQHGLLQQLLAQSQGVADGARQAVAASNQQVVDARRMQIANNIDRAQQALQLPDNLAQDFMLWAGERGYTLEDFIAPELAHRAMTDFRNGILSGDIQRLQRAAQNRTAFTGVGGQMPSAAPAADAGKGGGDFDQFAARMMAKKGI